MTCGHCEKAVTRAVQALDGQATVTIDRTEGRVQVDSEQPWQALTQAILDEGYAVTAPPEAA